MSSARCGPGRISHAVDPVWTISTSKSVIAVRTDQNTPAIGEPAYFRARGIRGDSLGTYLLVTGVLECALFQKTLRAGEPSQESVEYLPDYRYVSGQVCREQLSPVSTKGCISIAGDSSVATELSAMFGALSGSTRRPSFPWIVASRAAAQQLAAHTSEIPRIQDHPPCRMPRRSKFSIDSHRHCPLGQISDTRAPQVALNSGISAQLQRYVETFLWPGHVGVEAFALCLPQGAHDEAPLAA